MEQSKMQEAWIQWKPIENLEGKYFIESICNMMDGLYITFDPPEKCKNPQKLKFFLNTQSKHSMLLRKAIVFK